LQQILINSSIVIGRYHLIHKGIGGIKQQPAIDRLKKAGLYHLIDSVNHAVACKLSRSNTGARIITAQNASTVDKFPLETDQVFGQFKIGRPNQSVANMRSNKSAQHRRGQFVEIVGVFEQGVAQITFDGSRVGYEQGISAVFGGRTFGGTVITFQIQRQTDVFGIVCFEVNRTDSRIGIHLIVIILRIHIVAVQNKLVRTVGQFMIQKFLKQSPALGRIGKVFGPDGYKLVQIGWRYNHFVDFVNHPVFHIDIRSDDFCSQHVSVGRIPIRLRIKFIVIGSTQAVGGKIIVGENGQVTVIMPTFVE